MKKLLAVLLVLAFALSSVACGAEISEKDIPDDFSFSLIWNCNGESTFDSQTGKLVKQKVATKVEDYTTTFLLTSEQKAEIYNLIAKMKPETYPDEYNPIKGLSEPSRNIVLTVTMNGKTKTISCNDVSFSDSPIGVKGRRFIKVHDTIVDIVTNSDEWLALPDYEFLYD